MKKITAYMVVEGETADRLSYKVGEFLNDEYCWQPFGNLVVNAESEYYKSTYSQAMVTYDD